MSSRSRRSRDVWEPLCWDCRQVALPATGACPHCGAELRGSGPSPGTRPQRVTRTWHATCACQLATFSGWLHDADWDDDLMRFEDDGDTLVIPFMQEITTVEECGQAPSRVVARTTGGRERSATPLVWCNVRLRHVTAVAITMEERNAPRMFCCCEHNSTARRVDFAAVVGPELHVTVERLDLTIEMTDVLAHYRHGYQIDGPARWDAQSGGWW